MHLKHAHQLLQQTFYSVNLDYWDFDGLKNTLFRQRAYENTIRQDCNYNHNNIGMCDVIGFLPFIIGLGSLRITNVNWN